MGPGRYVEGIFLLLLVGVGLWVTSDRIRARYLPPGPELPGGWPRLSLGSAYWWAWPKPWDSSASSACVRWSSSWWGSG